MNFDQAPEFQKELKRLGKKWLSLSDDIEYVKPRIESLYVSRDDQDTNLRQYRADFFAGKTAAIIAAPSDDMEAIKMRLDVASLGRNDKVRVVFVAVRSRNSITFIELYAKNEKDREDTKRIKKYLA